MKVIDKTLLLFLVIVLEGYIVLSAEMLAIRQSIPFVGSGTDTVSIIIAAVLMPLAFGYYAGGRYRASARKSVRKKLVFNLVVAQAVFAIGLSYYPLTLFFYSLMDMGVKHRLVLTTLYSVLFLVLPVFLLGQTIPLVSNYFSKERLSKITGRMLFFSTLGSFLGAVFTTLVLMAFVGVHYTVVVLAGLLTLLVVVMSRKLLSESVVYSLALFAFAAAANSGHVMNIFKIVENNQYNTVMVLEDEDQSRHMVLNLTASSLYRDDGKKHKYVELVERQLIDPIRTGDTPKDILIIGAGAFTFGLEDNFNNYDFIDLDKSLKKISEDLVLKQKLGPNKHFYPVEARAYLMGTDKKYDVILLDAYNGDLTIPEHLVTKDFYVQVRNHLKDKGIVASNFIVSPNFESPFSRHIDNTFRAVFPYVSRIAIEEKFMMWSDDPDYVTNVIYLYRHHADERTNKIYTDNRNTIFYDKPQTR